MAGWLQPVLKALPYLTQIVTATVPVFTAKQPSERPDDLQNQQIGELQTAVTHNAETVKGLALQLKETIEVIDRGTAELQGELKRTRRLVVVALVVAIVSLGVTTWTLVGGIG